MNKTNDPSVSKEEGNIMNAKTSNMKSVIFFTVFFMVAFGTSAMADFCGEDYQGRPCQVTTDNCLNVADTSTIVQAGGEGSVGTEDSCIGTPARDADGNVVEADIDFHWIRTATTGDLILTMDNVSCDMVEGEPGSSDITYLWFNVPDAVSSCVLKTAMLDGTNVCGDSTCDNEVSKGWEMGADANGEGCLGSFDMQLSVQGQPNQLGVSPGQTIVLTLDCAGADLSNVTACDIANDGSEGEVGERSAKVALHFQNTDDDNFLSNKVSSNCQDDLYVVLAEFSATGDNDQVLLEWSTHLEVDNAGFYLLRRDMRDMMDGSSIRLNSGLIPAAGDLFDGAYYSYVDDTAVNGVQYEYLLIDVELGGKEGQHPGAVGIANPLESRIRLESPAYGSSDFRTGERPTFTWEAGNVRNTKLVISTDPTFSSRETTMMVHRSKNGSVTLNKAQARNLEALAAGNNGLFYWTVLESKLVQGSLPVTQTFAASYGVN